MWIVTSWTSTELVRALQRVGLAFNLAPAPRTASESLLSRPGIRSSLTFEDLHRRERLIEIHLGKAAGEELHGLRHNISIGLQ